MLTETLIIGTFNIALPTADVGTDGKLIYELSRGFSFDLDCISGSGNFASINATCLEEIPEKNRQYQPHPGWAALVLVPFLLNYFASWFTWYRIDKRKKITWLACVFNVYPQLRAANVIRELWKNPKRGLSKKRKFERELSEFEVFLEATVTTFVLSYILNISRNGGLSSFSAHHLGAFLATKQRKSIFWNANSHFIFQLHQQD